MDEQLRKKVLLILFTLTCLFLSCVPPQDTTTDQNLAEQPPATPTGFKINTTTLNTITISWNSVKNADDYSLFREESATGTFINEIYSGNQLSFTDTNLEENKLYYYKIQAINENGKSIKSSTISGKTKTNTEPPPIPQNLNISTISSTSITITWDISSTATSYELYRAIGTPALFFKIYDGPDNSFINDSLGSGQIYYYKVRALRDIYYSDYSDSISARTLGPPSAPTINFIGDATTSSLRIVWNPTDDADGYKLYQSAYDDDMNLLYTIIYEGPNTEYISSGLHISWKYFYMVSAYNEYGEGVKSSKVFSNTLDGLESLHTSYDNLENHTYFDADTCAYKNGAGTVIYTELYDDNNNYLGCDFTMIFLGDSPGTKTGVAASLKYGFSEIESTSCTIIVMEYGDIGSRISGTFSAVLENGKTLTGDFSVIRSPDN